MSIPRQAARRADRRSKAEAILTAAARVFLAAGFGAVTMDAIAEGANVSKATVYAHFGGKDELFRAVIEHVRAISEQRVGGYSVEGLDPHDIVGSLTAIAARYLDLVLSREAIALNRIIMAEVGRFPVLGQIFWSSGPERHR